MHTFTVPFTMSLHAVLMLQACFPNTVDKPLYPGRLCAYLTALPHGSNHCEMIRDWL